MGGRWLNRVILMKGYSNVVTAFRYDPPVGSLLLA